MTDKLFFTSDTHWGHEKILKVYQPHTRIGTSVDDMDDELIQRWNDKIPPDGIVYHLGDVTFHRNVDKIADILSRLNGTIHLVYGNHDDLILKHASLQRFFASITPLMFLKISNRRAIVLCHYPIRSWQNQRHGAFHLYGHAHGALESVPYGRSMDVGVDARPGADMAPWSYHEIEAILSTRPISDPRDDVSM